MTTRDVVFVGHATDRTGPPLALLRLLRAITTETGLDVELVLFRGGPLLEAFEALCPTTVVGEPVQPHGTSAPARARAAVINARLASAVPRLRRAKLIYLNTSWTIRLLALLGPSAPPVAAHVHELDLDIGDLLPARDLRRLRRLPDRYVVGTSVAADNLVQRHGIDRSAITVHPYFVDPDRTASPRRPAEVPAEAVLVGASGVTIWRKAPDLFVQMASRVLERTDRPVRFVWIGGAEGGPASLGVPADIEALGLDDVVHFVGAQDDPWAWFAGLDVLTLTSREDTFPLVCLEAGSLGVPVVTFDQGGIPAMVEACDGGAVVPHLDVVSMADAVIDLVENADRRMSAGKRLARHIADEHGPARGAELAQDIVRMVRTP